MDEGRCIKYPKLYILGQQNVLFNPPIFFRSLSKGIFHAIVIFFVLMGCYYQNFYSGDGYEVDYQSFGYIASGALTFIVTLQVSTFVYSVVCLCMCLCIVCMNMLCVCNCVFVYSSSDQIYQHWFLFSHRSPWIRCTGL